MAANANTRRVNPWRILGWTIAGMLLVLPLLAMQFTDEVQWTFSDFVFAAILILGVGIPFELTVRKTGNTAFRVAAGIALSAAFLIIWLSGAVGIIGSENNDANMMYAGVLTIAVVGVIVARFRPHGMARAMFATAFAQGSVGVIALAGNLGAGDPSWPWDVVFLTIFFTSMWLFSGSLFRRAAGVDRQVPSQLSI
jgi:hypothetical protein